MLAAAQIDDSHIVAAHLIEQGRFRRPAAPPAAINTYAGRH